MTTKELVAYFQAADEEHQEDWVAVNVEQSFEELTGGQKLQIIELTDSDNIILRFKRNFPETDVFVLVAVGDDPFFVPLQPRRSVGWYAHELPQVEGK